MTEFELKQSSKIQLKEDLLFSKIGNEIMLLSEESGDYLRINEVGSKIWELIQKPVSISHITVSLLEEFEVTEEQCKIEVYSFIEKLYKSRLIRII